jgi:hypothetical protein
MTCDIIMINERDIVIKPKTISYSHMCLTKSRQSDILRACSATPATSIILVTELRN